MIKFKIIPYDVVFFGSGRPFNVGDVVYSIFPYPHTLAGAICAKIHAHTKIDTSKILKNVYGPFIEKGGKLYFPKPSSILGERKKEEVESVFQAHPYELNTKLFRKENTNADSNIKTFPLYMGKEDIGTFPAFISIEGLRKWLKGEKIEIHEILQYKEIFTKEERVGIKMDSTVNAVGGEENALYRIEFMRLKEDVSLVVWIEFDFEAEEIRKTGFSDENKLMEIFNQPPRALKIGGEMKNAFYELGRENFLEFLRENLGVSQMVKVRAGDIVKVLFLTPGVFPNFKFYMEGFEMFSMVLEKYTIVGKYSPKLKIRKTVRAFPSGTVMWFEAKENMLLMNPTFIVPENGYCSFKIPSGEQDFIGSNLILIGKEEVKNV
ncbi:type III-B CRISPR module-associated protein Cmr3 [Caldanaerobacter subterraneus]|nr:type III-B CRISPR module-associated protein Cmr3 [Caldanaerobacter subterraneus]